MRMRDSLRQKVYNAQYGILRDERMSQQATRDYFDHVMASDMISEMVALLAEHAHNVPAAHRKITLNFHKRGGCFARPRTGEIFLEAWGFTKGTVLHEIAHMLIPSTMPGHGVEFIQTFASLLEWEQEGAGELFVERLKKSRVRTEHPRNRATEIRRGVRHALSVSWDGDTSSLIIVLANGLRVHGLFSFDEENDALVLKSGLTAGSTRGTFSLSEIRYITR